MSEPPYIPIRSVVKAAVAMSGRTQASIAAEARMAPAQLSQYLTGKEGIRDCTLDRLFVVLDIRACLWTPPQTAS